MVWPQDKNIATREAGSVIINYISDLVPQFLSGSADLHGSNKNYIKTGGNYGESFFAVIHASSLCCVPASRF